MNLDIKIVINHIRGCTGLADVKIGRREHPWIELRNETSPNYKNGYLTFFCCNKVCPALIRIDISELARNVAIMDAKSAEANPNDDAVRLDWLDSQGCNWNCGNLALYRFGCIATSAQGTKTIREAIDEAMELARQNEV